MKKQSKLFLLSLSLLFVSCGNKTKSEVSSSLSLSEASSESSSCEETTSEVNPLEKRTYIKGGIYTLPDDLGQVYESMDENVAAVSEGKLFAKESGKTKLKVSFSSKTEEIEIEVKESIPDQDFTYYDFENRMYGAKTMKGTGTQDVLVIPVSIKGFEENATSENLSRINTIFNGGEDITWESVHSFYEKSSYGKLNLNFLVADQWFDLGMDPGELYTHDTYGDCGADYVAAKALEWYKTTYAPKVADIDKNNDGYVDGIWLIYDSPDYTKYDYVTNYGVKDDSGFWAFTAESYEHYQKEDGVQGDPIIKSYGWASINFSDNFHKEGTIDAHTFIHETGHMLGLNDYYSTYYGYDATLETPLGCVDMMDNNICDHNAFSKFALGWIKPTVVNETMSIELKPFEESGEFLLLSGDNYNGSPFDEYFTVEYITPTGLNAQDALNTYPDNGTAGYSEPGVRIIHVDARLTNDAGRFVDNVSEGTNHDITNTNHTGYTKYYDAAGYNPLYHLTLMQENVDSADVTVLSRNLKYRKGIKAGSIDPDDALFHSGDFFHLARTSPYRVLMPSNSDKMDRYAVSKSESDIFPYRISIDSMDEEKALISVYRIR